MATLQMIGSDVNQSELLRYPNNHHGIDLLAIHFRDTLV